MVALEQIKFSISRIYKMFLQAIHTKELRQLREYNPHNLQTMIN